MTRSVLDPITSLSWELPLQCLSLCFLGRNSQGQLPLVRACLAPPRLVLGLCQLLSHSWCLNLVVLRLLTSSASIIPTQSHNNVADEVWFPARWMIRNFRLLDQKRSATLAVYASLADLMRHSYYDHDCSPVLSEKVVCMVDAQTFGLF